MIASEKIIAGTNPETVADLANRSFYVVLHDVAPCFASQISAIVDALEPLIGTRLAAAVVPCWHGEPIGDDDIPFVRFVGDRFNDILLHGFTHSRIRGRGMISLITGAADEFNGLSAEEAESRLSRGQSTLREYFDRPACGFIAPTFQSGRLTAARLAQYGLHYTVGFRHVRFSSGRSIPLATWCWDMGRWQALGYAGHWYGNLRMRLYRNLLPCLAIHPVDIDRGFQPLIVDLVGKLLESGRRPIVFGRVSA
jgi:hypothetical protein